MTSVDPVPRPAKRIPEADDRDGRPMAGARTVLLVALASAGVTSIGSWHASLWTDESATISASRRSLADLWRMVHTIDAVHGLYYAFMHFWTGAFGTSPLALRLPSALAVGAAAGCVFALGRLLADARTAAASAAIFTFLPRASWSGIEARSYALTALVAVGATLVLVLAVRRPRTRLLWVAYACLLGAGIALNVYLALLAVAHLASLLSDRSVSRTAHLRWLAAAVCGVVIGSPVVLEARTQTAQLGGTDLRLSNLARNIVVNQWFLGDTPTTTTGRSTTRFTLTDIGSWWPIACVALALIGWCLVLGVAVRCWRRRGDTGSDRSVLRWAGPWLVLPTAVIGSYSILVHPMYSPRYLTFAAPALGLAIGRGLAVLSWRRLRLATGMVMIIAAVPVLVSQRQLYAKNGSDWAAVAEYLGQHRHDGDAVYYSPRYPSAPPPIGQTTRGIAVAYPAPFAGLTDLTLSMTPAAAGNLTGISVPLSTVSARLARFPTVWVIRRLDYPSLNATADDHLLTSAGLTPSVVWRGPLDEVIRFNHE